MATNLSRVLMLRGTYEGQGIRDDGTSLRAHLEFTSAPGGGLCLDGRLYDDANHLVSHQHCVLALPESGSPELWCTSDTSPRPTCHARPGDSTEPQGFKPPANPLEVDDAACFVHIDAADGSPRQAVHLAVDENGAFHWSLSRARDDAPFHKAWSVVARNRRSSDEEAVKSALFLPALTLEGGPVLRPLLQDAGLVQRLSSVRRHLARELGIRLPPIHIRANDDLAARGFTFSLRDVDIAGGEIEPAGLLAIGAESKLDRLRGTRTADPTYGMPAVWLRPEQRPQAEELGLMIFRPIDVLATAVTEACRKHAEDLLTRDHVQYLLDLQADAAPVTLRCALETLSLGEIRQVLKRLLREGVGIRNLATILEVLADHAPLTPDPEDLAEFVRIALGRQICAPLVDDANSLTCFTLSPDIEQVVVEAIARTDTASFLTLDITTGQRILAALQPCVQAFESEGRTAILLTSQKARPSIRKLTDRSFKDLVVLSWNEIPPHVTVRAVAAAELAPPAEEEEAAG